VDTPAVIASCAPAPISGACLYVSSTCTCNPFGSLLTATCGCFVVAAWPRRTSILEQQQPQQEPWLQQVGQLPCIQDTSDTLPSTDILLQHHSAIGASQQPHAGVLYAEAHGAAAYRLDTGIRTADQDGAANSTRQQQASRQSKPLTHMCFESQSKDALVLLSDCDTTVESYRPS
jgi:hypothetical protein